MQQVTGTLKELGATVCAITPQLAEATKPLIEKHKITFDLLSDHGNEGFVTVTSVERRGRWLSQTSCCRDGVLPLRCRLGAEDP